MQLTGVRRTIQTMLLASVASAGALAFALATHPGYAVHFVYGEPTRHYRGVYPAGNGVTTVVGFFTLVACMLALAYGTPRAVVRASLTLFGLLPLCLVEAAFTDSQVYGIVETWETARLVRQAVTFIAYSPIVLGLSFAVLYALEHWRRPRTALPTAQLRD